MNEPLRVWLDDCRPAPDGWLHARTNAQAKGWLRTGDVVEISLDHDLGYKGPLPGPCQACNGVGSTQTGPSCVPEGCACEWETCEICEGDGVIGQDVLYFPEDHEETGYDLVKWMIDNDHIPERISIHSWNVVGAERMALAFRDIGVIAIVKPYEGIV